ncbi:MAG TPA: trypsin-like peptidase domain-containing protein [Trebonia sp.]|nr:trypsin-like peptidase domain-containing protein [Trebonia sp.]
MIGEDSGYRPFLTRRRGNALTHFLMAVLGAGLALLLLLVFFSPASGGSGISMPGGDAVPSPAASAPPLAKNQQDIASRVQPGVVIINTTLQYDSEAAAGTGMVVNPSGLVLTNNHVIEDSTSITATVPATGKTYTARVLGYDKTGDIALVQLQGASGLATVPIGNSSPAKAGETVVALGNAGGQNKIATAAGQVTGLNQTITASDEAGSTSSETLHGMIQTNADIVPGDSGGPLSGSVGVIGMDTAGSDASASQQAVGFAIPINTALSVARQIAAGRASAVVAIGYPAFLGIFLGSGSDSNPQDQAQQQGQQSRSSSGSSSCSTSNAGLTSPSAIAPVNSGALVDGTICGSPADKAGITGGAVITAVNGQAVGSPDQLGSILARFHSGDTISVTWVSPSGQRTTSGIRLAAGPPQ